MLGIDTAQLSKIEKGIRTIKKEQIPILAEVLNIIEDELLILWLADQLYNIVKDEKFAAEAILITEERINVKNIKKK